MMKMLIVYYSWSNGNTAKIAEQLQRATGADIARIETVKPYEGSYMEVVDQGQREVQEGFKPAIRSLVYDPADYDVIAVGTPTWWYTMAPAMKSFYAERGAFPVIVDEEALDALGVGYVKADIISETDVIHHDPVKLSRNVMKMVYALKENAGMKDYYIKGNKLK